MSNSLNITPRQFAMLSPLHLGMTLDEKYLAPKHLQLLNEYLLKMIRGDIRKLIISMPPGHGKSLMCSVNLPLLLLEHNPDNRIYLLGYNDDFISGFSNQCRNTIQERRDLFTINLNKSKNTSTEFWVDGFKGYIKAAGLQGTITGKRGDWIIVDDPVKGFEDANSPTIREKIWKGFQSNVKTRMMPDTRVLVIMTRWHEDDLAGRILQHEGEQWTELRLPAICDSEYDPLGREIGQALWQDMFSKEFLINQKYDSYTWNSLYQQKPSPEGDGLFKPGMFRYYDRHENHLLLGKDNKIVDINSLSIHMSADLAITGKQNSDYTVFLVYSVTKDNDIIVLDMYREQVEASKHRDILTQYYQKWKPTLIKVESVQYQASLVQTLVNDGLPVKGVKPDKDKFSRALPLASKFEHGKVYFPKPVTCTWVNDIETELMQFPNGKHDDIVDTLAYASLDSNEPTPFAYKATKKNRRNTTFKKEKLNL